MRLIDAELLKEELRTLYAKNGWGDRDIHFSLMDMENNIDGQKSVFEDIDMLQLNQTLNEVRTALLRPFFGGDDDV